MMHLVHVAAALIALSFSSSTAQTITSRDQSENIHIQWHFDKTSNEHALSVMDQSRKNVLAHSCTKEVQVGGKLILVDVDKDAEGRVTIDGHPYTIHSRPEHSGGIVCDSMYNAEESFFTCSAALNFGESIMTALDVSKAENCFKKPGVGHLRGALKNMVTVSGILARRDAPNHFAIPKPEVFPEILDETQVNNARIHARQFACGIHHMVPKSRKQAWEPLLCPGGLLPQQRRPVLGHER